jgi:hypothetical protein
VEAFFPKLDEFQKPPRHPKWREVNIAATLPGWNRFEVAQMWLDSQRPEQARPGKPATAEPAAEPGPRLAAPPPVGPQSASTGADRSTPMDSDLYKEFLRWRQHHQ